MKNLQKSSKNGTSSEPQIISLRGRAHSPFLNWPQWGKLASFTLGYSGREPRATK